MPRGPQGAALYHCGPVALKKGDRWFLNAAGPTTSSREEPYQAEVISKCGMRAVIGKGGMGAENAGRAEGIRRGLPQRHRRSRAVLCTKCITAVDGVDFLEFGVPEAMWHITVKDFPAIVTMDAHGNSLHADVEKELG